MFQLRFVSKKTNIMAGTSQAMRDVDEQIALAAGNCLDVLIRGAYP